MSTADPDLCRFAARTMTGQLEALEKELGGASEEDDIEFVHRSRVASRRLRASLAIFEECCPPKEFRDWTRTVRRITRSLGTARDLDVQIEFLRGYIDREAGDASLHRMLSSLCRERSDVQEAVDGSLAQFKASAISEDMRSWASNFDGCEDIDLSVVRRKGLLNVLPRLDELYSFESYVADPNAIEKHHEMRIAGKRLRYTVEIFAASFGDGIKPYIKRLKEMQDVLGEMHDCDVWIARLKGRKGGAGRLLADRATKRMQLHARFVELWNGMSTEHLPEMERTMRESAVHQGRDLKDITGPVGLISDVHGNLPALLAVLRDAEEAGAAGFLNAGDSIGAAPFNIETLGEMAGRGIVSVIGNVDRELLTLRNNGKVEGRAVLDPRSPTTKKILSELSGPEVEWLELLPRMVRQTVGGRRVLLVHASPLSDMENVLDGTPEERFRELARSADADIVICGHSHMALDREIDGVRFINPGSVGRQVDGDPRASYALWDPANGTVELRRVAYPVHELLDRLIENEWPPEAGDIYVRGGPANAAKTAAERTDDAAMLEMAESVARANGSFDDHSRHVKDLARTLFTKLMKTMGLKRSDLVLLECAALMHDVGWSWGGSGHHRSSFDIIVMSPTLKLPLGQRLLIANIARYHRGGTPKRSHGNLSHLDGQEQERMRKLAAILRIADGLDYGHAQRASIKKVRMDDGVLLIELRSPKGCENEISSALKKSDLFKKTTGLEVDIS